MAATNSISTFAAIAYNEVLFNSKRVAPYALIVLFSAVAVMGWIKGPAVALGWATNSDFYIARGLKAFSFLFGLPIFTAMIMGDAVIRDFRVGVDPLIFSKPLSRAHYLLGKFFGNFFVLNCLMAAFPLTQMALQAFQPSQMVVQPVRVLPYFTHFIFFVVITQLAFAAFFFMVGALTRNNKIVYLLAVCFYPVYISSMVFLVRGLPATGKNLFDPFLLNAGPSNNGFGNSAEYLNQYVFSYTPDLIWNRVGMILAAVICLTWLYFRFTTADGFKNPSHVSLGLSTATTNAPYDSDSSQETTRERKEKTVLTGNARHKIGFRTSFFAIFQNELLLNSRRVAPYFMALLCAGNGLLWWGWGPARGRGWAVNSDAFIAGALPVYSFLTLPLFTAVIMADAVIRDFQADINPLIFSKPIGRAQYLLGKFFGSFFVLVCGQAAFVIMWFLLQAVPKKDIVTHGVTVFPYVKHFLIFVVISHLPLAAFYFTVGTLTRNAKIGYALGIAFYPLIIAYNLLLLNKLPQRLQVVLDPLLMRWDKFDHNTNAAILNQHIVVYDADLIINRAAMILIAAICLAILYRRFTTIERSKNIENLSVLNLVSASDHVYYPESSPTLLDEYKTPSILSGVAVPEVARLNKGIRAGVNKLVAALGIEFQLLFAERSLVVVMPLAIFFSILEVGFYNIRPDISYSAAYATNTAKLLLLFLIGIAVFYTGEAMHRDREVKIEHVLWSTPITNEILILSKYLATIALTLSLIIVVGLIAIVIQLVRGHTPVDPFAYLIVYGVVLVPGIVFLTSLVVALNVLLRNKHLVYVVVIGTGAVLVYLYNIGYNHWLYNPMLYQLWKYQDLTSGRILVSRLYYLALAGVFLALAHFFFARKSR